MSWLTDYCKAAERTDRLSGRCDHVTLLAAGLFGESGSVLAELKKIERETGAYPSDRNRLTEEIGDVLWYLVRLVSILAPSVVQDLDILDESTPRPSRADAMNEALRLGGAAGDFLSGLQEGRPDRSSALKLRKVWHALLGLASAARIEISEAAQQNLQKTQSRWPPARKFVPLFDDDFDDDEQLPRRLEVEFREIHRGGRPVVLLRCNRLNLGDRLTDNIEHPDFYRFHDVFHFAHAVYLGWSPVLRALLNCKRKSNPRLDEDQDGARARIIEEAVSAVVFSRAKEMRFYDGIDHVDYDLLKTISEFVCGFEVQSVPLWQWETAILNGYRVFRDLQNNRCGVVTLDLINRDLLYSIPCQCEPRAEPIASIATAGD